MQIKDHLEMSLIIPDLKSSTKDEVLRELSHHVSVAKKLDEERLYQTLADRETLGSTGIEEGVAIPHGKISGISDMLICFGRSTTGIEFASRDEKPSHIFVVLFAPENDAGRHLKALARVSRLLKQADFRARIMEAKSREELSKIITEADATL